MYSIRLVGLLSVLAGAVLSHAQQLTSVATTPADVKPIVSDLSISGHSVTDLHLRPLFTTTIHLPETVTSVAAGAPTLFEVEHSDQEPRLAWFNEYGERRKNVYLTFVIGTQPKTKGTSV